MLEVGNGGMTYQEYRAHFSIWALAKVLFFVHNNNTVAEFFLVKDCELVCAGSSFDWLRCKKYDRRNIRNFKQ
jgi:hypothetical protein